MNRASPRAWAALLLLPMLGQGEAAPYGIEVVDRATGRGVPLVELETTGGILYVTDSAGRVAFDEPGPTWIDGLMVVEEGEKEVLVAHYVRVESLDKLLERGLARWDEAGEVLAKLRELPLDSDLHPAGLPVLVADGERRTFVFPAPHPQVRVPAELAAIGDPAAYEGFTCLAAGAAWSPGAPIERDAAGEVVWAWKRATAPAGEERERELVLAGRGNGRRAAGRGRTARGRDGAGAGAPRHRGIEPRAPAGSAPSLWTGGPRRCPFPASVEGFPVRGKDEVHRPVAVGVDLDVDVHVVDSAHDERAAIGSGHRDVPR
ncbi:MAG: hypothetical protein AB1726_18860 [Planctomycetota bacterium]